MLRQLQQKERMKMEKTISTIKKLELFSENNVNVGAECPDCGRILEIAKTSLQKTNDGFHLLKPSTCICGSVYSDIGLIAAPKDSNTESKIKETIGIKRHSVKGAEAKTKTGVLVFGGIIGVLLVFNNFQQGPGISFLTLSIIMAVIISIALLSGFQTQEQSAMMLYGSLNPHMTCPHCSTKGKIHTKHVTQRKGISGGKAVAGLLTGGVSLLVIGLSRKEKSTEARCGKCGNVWHF